MITKNCTMNRFMSVLGDKNLICFGAGLSGEVFLESFLKEGIEEKILFFVDNDSSKWGLYITIGSKSIPIKSPAILSEVNLNNSVIFITSRFWDQIHAQLESKDYLAGVECYVYLLMKSKVSDAAFIIPDGACLIPKKIHYCWFGEKPMSENEIKCIESWKKYCPDYEIVRWDESNYDVRKTRYLKEVYEYGHYSAVSSYARFDILNEQGGIYYDTDVEVIRSIDELLRLPAFMGFEVGNVVNTGHGFGTVKKNKICEEIIDCYNSMSHFNDKGEFHYTNCPIITSRVLANHGLIGDGSLQQIENITIFPNDYFDPAMQVPTSNTYSIHHYSSLWSLPGRDMAAIWKEQREYWDSLKELGRVKDV